ASRPLASAPASSPPTNNRPVEETCYPMYAIMSELHLTKPLDAELARTIKTEMLPLLNSLAGLRAYYFVRVADDQPLVVSIFESIEAMQDAIEQIRVAGE